MKAKLVFAKTPIGDEAVRQSTRVVQRNLRMVLVQVDGKMSVEELSTKIGNRQLVESALRDLEAGGFITPSLAAVSVWEESKPATEEGGQGRLPDPSIMSQFSTFGPRYPDPAEEPGEERVSRFSSFEQAAVSSSAREGSKASGRAKESERDAMSRPERRRLSVKSVLISGFALILVVFAAIAVFYPFERFKPGIEANASRLLKAPVRIDRVGVALWPSPHLKLSGVHIGASADSNIAEIDVGSPLSLLLDGPYRISTLRLTGAEMAINRLLGIPMFTGNTAGEPVLAFRKIVVDRSRATLGENIVSGELSGELDFRPDGSMEKAAFETVDRSLLITLQPDSQGVQLNIEGRAWQPEGSAVSFSALQAKGVLQKDKLLIRNIDTTFLGGILRGNWLLEWGNGLSMAGEGSFSRLDSRQVSAAFVPSLKIEGDMNGTIRLRSTGRDWGGLWANTEAELSTEITRGILRGIDLGEAVRRSGVSEVRAGATKFDRLRSTLNITPTQVLGRDVELDAGMVTASGRFVAGRNGQVDGSMAVTMRTSVASQRTEVRVFGTLPDLSASSRK